MNRRIVLACTSLALTLGLAACGAASSTPASSAAPAASGAGSSSVRLAGGYTEQRPLTEEDTALFESVMAGASADRSYEPVSVATQVVAGKNYRFAVKVTENGETKEVFITIFQPLPGKGEAEFVSEEAC